MRALRPDEVQEVEKAAELPQLDATELVDNERLESEIREMYTEVAEHPEGDFHFEMGRELAERLGYPAADLDRIPAEATESFAGVGYHLGLARFADGDAVADLGCGSGTDLFIAANAVGPSGRAIGIDMTEAQLEKAGRLRDEHGFPQVELIAARIEELPLDDESVDIVISNGVINLSPVKDRVFAEVARVLRPGGRLAVADIVSTRALAERTRRNTDLWAACIAGAIPSEKYSEAIEGAGLAVESVSENEGYRFITERAVGACDKYGVMSVSVLATK